MEPVTLRQLREAVGGTLLGDFREEDATFRGVDTDSRRIRPGSLFVPLTGERFDGHAFVDGALEAGAAGTLTARDRDFCRPDRFFVRVPDTEAALGDLAAWYRRQFSVPVAAVTGSVGKTTTKDMAAAVLGVKFRVCSTRGNFNNAIGLPLSMLEMDRSTQVAVLEMGMDRPGEIDRLSALAAPDLGVITNIGDAHIQRLGSRENIFRAKCELIGNLSRDGLLILNGDDPLLATLRGKTPMETVFVGQGEGMDYRARILERDGEGRLHCLLHTPRMDREVVIPALGRFMVYPVLTAAALAERLGLTGDEIEQGISRFVPTRMRMNILRRAGGITILDDTYNANPQSMRAAISVLADSRSRWKAAILGDMLELGPFAPALHGDIGVCLGRAGADCLVAVGEMAPHLARGARESGVRLVYEVRTREEAIRILPEILQEDSTFLVKASRGMRMEEIVQALLRLTRPEEEPEGQGNEGQGN